MFSSPTVIWSDAIMQEPCLFSRRKARGGQKDRDLRMPSNPRGASVFFWRSRAMQRSGLVWPWHCLLFGHSSRPGVGKLPRSLTRFFSILCLTVMGNVWKHALCVLDSPSQMALCGATTAPTDGGWGGENGSGVWTKSLFSLLVSGREMSHVWESEKTVSSMCWCPFGTWHLMFVHSIVYFHLLQSQHYVKEDI